MLILKLTTHRPYYSTIISSLLDFVGCRMIVGVISRDAYFQINHT